MSIWPLNRGLKQIKQRQINFDRDMRRFRMELAQTIANLPFIVDLDDDPFAQCEQDLLDRPEPRGFPVLEGEEED